MVTISNWIDVEDIEIDTKEVCRILGYHGDYKLTARISSIIDGYVEHIHQIIEPSYSYVIRDIERVRRSSVFIEGLVVFESGILSRLLAQCRKVAIFAATIGKRLEEMVLKLSTDGLVLQSAVLDAVGSVATNNVADFVQNKINDIASNQGLVISRRFSPGYCDWTIRQQKEVFRVINGDSAGISLTEGWLMLPRKSISGIIGIGHSYNEVERYNPCKTCKKRDCLGRR